MTVLGGFPTLPDGSLDLDGVSAIASTINGLPVTGAGKIAVAVEGAPATVHNGLSFDAAREAVRHGR
jgi:hypothetical protein